VLIWQSWEEENILVGWEPILQLRMLHRNDKIFVAQAASPPCMTYAYVDVAILGRREYFGGLGTHPTTADAPLQ